MSAIKNCQILLYCQFNKITQGSGTNVQSQTLREVMFEMFVIQHTSILPNFILIVLRIKEISISVTSIM